MLPKVILHNAVSLDGRIDWFTPDVEQFYALIPEWKEDATLAGSETIFNATESPFTDEGSQEEIKKEFDENLPLLVVPDSQGRMRNWNYWRRQPYWRDIIVLCSLSTPENYIEFLDEKHIQYIVAGTNRVDLRAALEELYERFNVRVVRVDSGGVLNGVLLRSGLADEISLLVHPCLVGGASPKSFFKAADLTRKEDVIHLKLKKFEVIKNNLFWLQYEVEKKL